MVAKREIRGIKRHIDGQKRHIDGLQRQNYDITHECDELERQVKELGGGPTMEERRQRDGENRARQQQQQELAADDDGGGGGCAEGTASESSTYYVHSPHGGSPQEVGATLYNPASPVGESSSTEPTAAHAQAKRFHLQQTSGTFFQHEERGGHDRRRQQPRKRQRQKEQQTPDDGDTIAAPTTRLSRHFSIDETKAYWLNVRGDGDGDGDGARLP